MSFCGMLTKENLFSKHCINAYYVFNGRDTYYHQGACVALGKAHLPVHMIQWIHFAQSVLETKRTELSRPEKWGREQAISESWGWRRPWRELLLNRQAEEGNSDPDWHSSLQHACLCLLDYSNINRVLVPVIINLERNRGTLSLGTDRCEEYVNQNTH